MTSTKYFNNSIDTMISNKELAKSLKNLHKACVEAIEVSNNRMKFDFEPDDDAMGVFQTVFLDENGDISWYDDYTGDYIKEPLSVFYGYVPPPQYSYKKFKEDSQGFFIGKCDEFGRESEDGLGRFYDRGTLREIWYPYGNEGYSVDED